MGPSARTRRIAVWIVLATAVAAAVLFVVVRSRMPSDGARVAFYAEAWSPSGAVIAPIDRPAAGLRAGDRITAVDGVPLERWLGRSLDTGASRPAPSSSIAYDLERDGTPLRLDVSWAPPGIAGTLASGWSLVVVSVVFAAVAAFILRRRPDEPAAVPIALCAAGLSGSSVPWYLGATVSDVVLGWPFAFLLLLTGLLYMLMWPAGLHFALVFPRRLAVVERRPWLVPAVYAVPLGAYGVAIVGTRLAAASHLEWIGLLPLSQLAVIVPTAAAGMAVLFANAVRTRDPVARTRVRWVVLGGLVSGVVGLAAFFLPELLTGSREASDEWIGLVAMPLPLGLAAAILRDRLFDIDVAINRTLVYGGLTLGVLASYVGATWLLGAIPGPEHGFAMQLLATGAAALVALPLRDALQRGVNRLMYGDRDEPWRAVRRLGQRLELAAEPELAFPTIVRTVAESLRLPYVGLAVAGEGADGDDEHLVAEQGTDRGPTVALPLAHGAVPVGRLVLGIRPGERDFRPDERGLLDDLARQAGAAVHAIALRQDLARSRERLVLAREEERRRLRRDLHDGLGPSLAAIGLRAEASAETMATDPAAARRMLEELGADVRTALADVRRLVDGLRPPALDELGLAGAIQQQASRLEGPATDGERGITITVRDDPSPLPELAAAVEVAAYRIAVEAMTNAVRHAAARRCEIRIDATDPLALTVEVADDGRGLPADAVAGVGLESIRARADELGGSVDIELGPGGGTRLVARLPLAAG